MRRFEYVEGSSSKFWSAEVEGPNFIVVFGRIGTPGQRKEKTFPSDALAQQEMDKKIAEKLREGYAEVNAEGGPHGAAAAPSRPALPPRFKARKATAPAIAQAIESLGALEAEVGGRSWRVAMRARKARRALGAITGYDPARNQGFTAVFDALVGMATAPQGSRRLPLRHLLGLFAELDTDAFTRAVAKWKAANGELPPAVRAIVKAHEVLGDDEIALRFALSVAERPGVGTSSEGAWERRWSPLKLHVNAWLTQRGSSLGALVGAIDTAGDAHLARRLARMNGA